MLGSRQTGPKFTVVDDEVPTLALDDRLVPWGPDGYGLPMDRPHRGQAIVLTPLSTVAVIRQGYRPVLRDRGG